MAKNQSAYKAYKEEKHWETHPAVYAEEFSQFLKGRGFLGRLVDVGCGNGRDVEIFRKNGFDVLGIEADEGEIKLGKAQFPACSLEVQDPEHLTLPSGSVGAIFAENVIHYIDYASAAKEFFRVLAPGGYAFIHFNLELREADGTVDYRQKREEVLELFNAFDPVLEKQFERTDMRPKKHTHVILELIIQKPAS